MDPGEDCQDVEDGWSFAACQMGKGDIFCIFLMNLILSGCPNSHVVVDGGTPGFRGQRTA